ncbi:tRNA (adenosine(37)-N6)-threonylcarbamoyltransferase complex dimerization subunit type 1 TsaB [uncultured Planktosalinus sp.]|uniref:tRNA (adenosine(37)-N6)-threonylcarbamoyltransferase complex dimerization subunit type 1 TsaB n=1 Tax=uncultured Planktosalinus sp. TaxID=1810935 RepID=UPI0030DB220A
MAYILCLETTTTNCSVSIAFKGKTIAIKELNTQGYSHAESLHVFIDEVLKSAGISKKELNAIAVSEGPGSYTGLRIGVSAAKGFCYALDLPLISIDTLQALSMQLNEKEVVYIPMLDARRMEVFTAVFDENYKKIEETKALILNENSFIEYLNKGKVVFLGNANDKLKTLCKHSNATFVDGLLPSAKEMGWLANSKYKKSDFENVAYFEPFYLKDFVGG